MWQLVNFSLESMSKIPLRDHIYREEFVTFCIWRFHYLELICTVHVIYQPVPFSFCSITFFSVKKKIHENCYFVFFSFYNGDIWLNFFKTPTFKRCWLLCSYSYFWRVEIRGLCQDSERILRNWGIWSSIKRQCLM